MLTALLALVLAVFILQWLWAPPRLEGLEEVSGYVPYTEEEKDKLLKNETNLKALQDKMDEMRKLAANVDALKASTDANAESIKTLL